MQENVKEEDCPKFTASMGLTSIRTPSAYLVKTVSKYRNIKVNKGVYRVQEKRSKQHSGREDDILAQSKDSSVGLKI